LKFFLAFCLFFNIIIYKEISKNNFIVDWVERVTLKIKKVEIKKNKLEETIIYQLINNDSFLKECVAFIDPSFYTNVYLKKIIEQIRMYWDKYKKAPKKDIFDLFKDYSEYLEEDEKDLILCYLHKITKKKKVVNNKYLVDKATTYFKEKRIELLKERMENASAEQAEALISGYRKITKDSMEVISLFDEKRVRSAFEKKDEENSFTLTGDVGRLIGPMSKGEVYAFMGRQKSGKSWFFLELAVGLVLQKFNTLFISFEMDEEKTLLRLASFLKGRPVKKVEDEKKHTNIMLPVFDCLLNQTNTCTRQERTCNVGLFNEKGQQYSFGYHPKEYVTCTACKDTVFFKPSSWFILKRKKYLMKDEAIKYFKKFKNHYGRGRLDFKQFSSFTTMEQVKTFLSNVRYYHDISYDAILIDYGNKMAGDKKLPMPYQKREIWEGCKSLAEKQGVIVINASQVSPTKKEGDVSGKDWADSSAAQDICSTAWCLNQTVDEKEMRRMRLRVIAKRHGVFNESDEALVLQEFSIGRALLNSYVPSFHRNKKRKGE